MAKILIVEDEAVTAQIIREFLENSEHTIVGVVETGAEAIQTVSIMLPDLILMDIFLKNEIDGIATTHEIRQRWGLPIIYLSAVTEKTIRQRAIATEPFGYLVKPFSETELQIAIEIALQRYHVEKRVEKQLERTERRLTTALAAVGERTSVTGGDEHSALSRNVEPVNSEPTTSTRDRQSGASGEPALSQDISQQKRSEDLLYRQEQQFRALVENLPDIVVCVDRNLRFLYANPSLEQMTGVPVRDYIGKTNQELGQPENLVAVWQSGMDAALLTRQEQMIEFEVATVDGQRYFQSRIVPETTQDGSIVSLLSVTRDITDRRQIEEALRLQAEREHLLGAIAQRIRESLELDVILNTAVTEVRQLLHADRVVIYRLQPNHLGLVIVESRQPEWISLLGREFCDPYLATEAGIQSYTQSSARVIHNVRETELPETYTSLLTQFQVQSNLAIPILEGNKLWGLMAMQQCSAPRIWEEWEVEFLTRLSTNLSIALQQSQLYQQTQQLVQREQSLNRVIQAVRNSLDLTTTFNTAVSEIGRLLEVDQANILQYFPSEGFWLHVATYCQNPDQTPYLGLEIPDQGNPQAAALRRGRIFRLNDTTHLQDEFSQILSETFPGAWLAVPLRVGSLVWGSIWLIKHEQPFTWKEWQVELTRAIADQLAIAIHQSELYTEVQRLNADLENQVVERTTLLQQSLAFEALLKRIADKVRDSLDENQILQTAVEELGRGLQIDYCGAAIYNADLTSGTITHEYGGPLALAVGDCQLQFATEPTSAVYRQLFQARYCQFCLIAPNPIHPLEENRTILACPVFDDQGILGDLWLFKPVQETFSEIEVRLVEQVANQCAIALRQSRLFQTAQAQVYELERLNRLKDDFLSTISHELRTPMSSIKMSIQMLEIALQPLGVLQTDAATATRYLQILQMECDREIELIDKLLNLSRLDAETEPLLPSVIQPHIWVSHAVEPFLEKIRTQQQTLELDLPEDLPSLITDLSCLGQILNELLTNACKYTPSGGTIHVFARSAPAGVQVGVTNTGVEISAEEIPRIFDKFYRIPSHDPWRHGGTGIGLALVKKLVAHLGATIEVTSASAQTTFTVTFTHDSRDRHRQ